MPTITCPQCMGATQVYRGRDPQTGKDIYETCPRCNGSGTEEVKQP